MPKVPTYDDFQVAQGGATQARFAAPQQVVDPGQQAAAMGSALSQTGEAVARVSYQIEAKANQVRINDAMNKAKAAQLKLTYDPAEGFAGLRGDAALTRPDGKSLDVEYGEKLQKQLDAIDTELGNDAQRLAFREQTAQLRMQFSGSIQQHVGREFVEYQSGVQEGTVKVARDQMALAWGDAKALEQSRAAIKAATAEQGRLRGWSAVQVEAATVEALSPGHAIVITSAVDAGKLDYAREYMKQVGAELTPVARLQITKVLDEGAAEQRAQDKADALWAKHPDDTAAALAEARSSLSGKEEDAVVRRIREYDAERTALRERAQKTAGDEAWGIYARTGSLSKVPPSILSGMDGRDLAALRRTATAESREREVKTDPTAYYALALASTDPAFKNTDLRQYFDRLSPSDRKHFIDLQAKAQRPDEFAEAATATQQINAVVKAVGLKDKDAGLFAMSAQQGLSAAAQEKGGKLNQAERQKVLDRLVLEGSSPGFMGFSSNTRLFKAQAAGEAFTPKWADADVSKATAALQKQGVEKPTQQQIDATLRSVYGVR